MINTAIKAAQSASKILLENFGKIESNDIKEKDKNDFLTFVDEQAESTIIKILKKEFPDHSILAEESGWQKQNRQYEWIIDPLDGTKNYISGIPHFSISIGLCVNKEMMLGIIFDPLKNELFTAQKDKGAYLNEKKIQVSTKHDLLRFLMATGFPFKKKQFLDSYLKSFHEIFTNTSGVRRMGSAAIDLAYVACGRFDGFWEIGLSPWDIAAGAILISEAGGRITDFWGEESFLSNGCIVASNGHKHNRLIEFVKPYFSQEDVK